jgi:hypothetical protein
MGAASYRAAVPLPCPRPLSLLATRVGLANALVRYTEPAWQAGLVERIRCNRLVLMSEPAHDLPVSPAVEQAVELARRGVITHLTINGERVAAIVPESVLDALRAAEDAEDAAEAEDAMREPGDSIPLEELEAEFGL